MRSQEVEFDEEQHWRIRAETASTRSRPSKSPDSQDDTASTSQRGSLTPQKLVKSVGYVYSEKMLAHASVHPDGHPECPERITEIHFALHESGLLKQMDEIPFNKATRDQIVLAHTEELWDKVESTRRLDVTEIVETAAFYETLSLYVNMHSAECALWSCGGVIEACLAVLKPGLDRSFAIVRPPGHHAEPDEHMGFCLYNNVAVAVKVVQKETNVSRILILDWDVHHGNGTQRAFENDPSVLYISVHRHDDGSFYPSGDYGGVQSCGTGDGLGYSVNIPWPGPGFGDADYIHAFQTIVMPIASEFQPELVIISAGFDAILGDPLGNCRVTPNGYAHMTHMLMRLASGKLVVALEGGYQIDETARASVSVAEILLGYSPPPLPVMSPSKEALRTIYEVARQQSRYWSCIDPTGMEEPEELEESIEPVHDFIKVHYKNFMHRKHEMVALQLVAPVFIERYGEQIMVTPDILTNEKLVIFVHEIGDLKFQLLSTSISDVDVENGYLLDASKEIANLFGSEGFALLDINLSPKSGKKIRSPVDEMGRNILEYLWDNLIELSSTTQIVLVGLDAGCAPLMSWLNLRYDQVESRVAAFIQIVGLSYKPSVPDVDYREWYKMRSLLVISALHPYLVEGERKQLLNLSRHGRLESQSDERNSVILLDRSKQAILDHIHSNATTPGSALYNPS